MRKASGSNTPPRWSTCSMHCRGCRLATCVSRSRTPSSSCASCSDGRLTDERTRYRVRPAWFGAGGCQPLHDCGRAGSRGVLRSGRHPPRWKGRMMNSFTGEVILKVGYSPDRYLTFPVRMYPDGTVYYYLGNPLAQPADGWVSLPSEYFDRVIWDNQKEQDR